MGTSLTGNNISASYLGLLKSTDSQAISSTVKRITDGAGNDLPLSISTSTVRLQAGTLSAPSLSFGSNSEGFYVPSDENIGFVIAGTEVARFNGSGITIGATKKLQFADDKINIGDTNSTLGTEAIGIGLDADATGNQSIAIGYNPQGTGAQGIAIGYNPTASGSQSTAIGYNVGATGTGTFVIGTSGSHSDTNTFVVSGLALKLSSYGSGNNTGTVTQRLGVTSSGQVVEIPIGAGALDGSGTAGKIAKFTDSDTLGDSLISESGSTISINGTVDANSFTDIITDQIFTAGSSLDIDTSLTSRDVTFSQGSNTLMTIKGDASGVGIGTTSLTAKLTIEDSGADMIDMTRSSVGTYRLAISGSDAFSIFDVGANADRVIISSSGDTTFNGDIAISKDVPSIDFVDTNSNSDFRLRNNNGAFEIFDTTNSTTPLSVSSSSDATFAGDVNIATDSATSSGKLTIQSQGANGSDETALVLRNYSASPFTGFVTTEFEIGTVNIAELSARRIDSNNGELIFRTKQSGTISETMRLDSSGNLGLGTTNATPSNGGGMCINGGSITRIDWRNSTTGDATGDGTSLQLNGNDFTIENRESGYVAISTSLTERMRITSDGSILVTSDGSDADGANITLKHANNNTTDTIGTIFFGNNADDSLSSISCDTATNNTSSNLVFSTSSTGTLTDHAFLNSDGNFGVGYFNPSAYGKFLVRDASANLINLDNTGGSAKIRFFQNGTGRFVLQSLDGSDGLAFVDGDGSSERARIDSSGNVAIGTTSVTTGMRLDVQGGDFRVGDDANQGLEGGYSAGAGVAFLQGYNRGTSAFIDLLLNNNVTIKSTGNVGIGETSPNDTLHVQGDVKIVSGVQKTPLFEVSSFIGGHTGDVAYIHCATPSSTGYNLLHVQGDSDDTPIEALVVRGDANVGIGTSSLTSIASNMSTLSLGGTNANVSGGIAYQVNGTAKAYHYVDSDGLFVHQASTGVGQKFFTNNSEAVRILSNGNVGISTTSPTAKLDVREDANNVYTAYFYNTDSGANANGVNVQTTSTDAGSYALRVNSASDTNALVVKGNGQTGIGVASPATKLNVVDSTALTAQFSGYSHASSSNNARPASGSIRLGDGSGSTGLLIDYTDQGQTVGLIKNEYVASTTSELRLQSPFLSFYTGTSASEKARIDSDGKLLLGLSSSDAHAGADDFQIKSSVDGGMTIRSGSDSGTGSIFFADTSSNSVGQIRYNHNTDDLTLTADDNIILSALAVGCGTTSPNAQLHVVDDGGTSATAVARFRDTNATAKVTRIQLEDRNGSICDGLIDLVVPNSDATSSYLGIGHNDSTQLVLANGGNVGIGGVTTPADKLTVTGGSINIQVPAGSLKLNEGTTDAWAIESNGANGYFRIRDAYNGSDRIRIDSNGNVGLSTTNPTMKLTIAHADQDGLRFTCADGLETFIDFGDASDNDIGRISYDHADNHMAFRTNNSERARITSGGNFLVGCTSLPSTSVEGFVITGTNSGNFSSSGSSTSAYNHLIFRNANDIVGFISTSGSATTYSTTSDYRLKEDLKDFNALEIASKIKMYDFKWKADDSRSYGVMAHELQEVVPQAVSGDKDAEDMQQVDYSKLVPILLKSIQELEARVQELEKEI